MLSQEAVRIHLALYSDDHIVNYRGRDYPIGRVKRPGKDFSIVEIEGKSLVTQNLEKPSSWTKWIKAEPGRKLTWIIHRKDGFIGKVQQEGDNIKVFTLKPAEHVDFECSTALLDSTP